MATLATSSIRHSRVSELPRRRPVGLRVFSDDLFLCGHFSRWEAAVAMGPDLDELTVRMAVDATSAEAPEDDASGNELFTFHATEIKKRNADTHEVRGEITTSSGTRPFRTIIETPEGENAFFVMSFIARREDLGFGWKELVSDVLGLGGIEAERRQDPRMGVRDPIVALS